MQTIFPGVNRVLVDIWNRHTGVNLNNFQLKTINFNDRRDRYHAILCEQCNYLFHGLVVLCLYRTIPNSISIEIDIVTVEF